MSKMKLTVLPPKSMDSEAPQVILILSVFLTVFNFIYTIPHINSCHPHPFNQHLYTLCKLQPCTTEEGSSQLPKQLVKSKPLIG